MSEIAAVTGATGLIGRHLVDQLLEQDKAVRILTRTPQKAEELWQNNVEIWKGDITDPASLAGFATDASTIYHLAGTIFEPQLLTPVNETGTKNLLRECLNYPIKRFVHLSSVGVIGTGQEKIIDEKTACHPQNDYERSKLRGEELVMQYAQEHKLPVTIMRPTIVFGPGRERDKDSFASWMQAIQNGRYRYIGHGKYAANYVYARDVAEACSFVAEHEQAVGEVYIVNDPYPLRDFVQIAADLMEAPQPSTIPLGIANFIAGVSAVMGKLLKMSLPLTPARVKALTSETTYSDQKLRRDLGFKPSTGIEQGLIQTIHWYQDQGTLQ